MKNWTVYEHITPNGKRYIGITRQKPEKRWQYGGGYNKKDKKQLFYKAIEKYGWDNIQHNIVSSDLTETEAKWLENYLICYYRTFVGFSDCNGYNCNFGGDGNTGIKFSEEHNTKISKSRKGIKFSEEHKRRISEAQKGDKNYWYGKHRSEETRIKMSTSNKGQHCPTKGMHRVYHEDGTFHMER